jgi:very-short-patch-repair endonuclease
MEQCKICNFESDSKGKLAKHILFTHKLKKGEYLIKVKYKGEHPKCKCGCGTLMVYNATLADFPTYIKKHLHILQKGKTQEEIFGDMNSPKRIEAISKARKKAFSSGKWNEQLKNLKKPRSQKIKDKISKGAKGIPKPKPKGFGIGRSHSNLTKDKMSKSAVDNLIKQGKVKRSNLEYKFEEILDSFNIEYKHSLYIKYIGKIYDFYLPEYNILIEVDGDFWHSNPNSKYKKPTCKSQFLNIENDKFKNKWAKDNGYQMLRFWETDINTNIEQVKQKLLESCKK